MATVSRESRWAGGADSCVQLSIEETLREPTPTLWAKKMNLEKIKEFCKNNPRLSVSIAVALIFVIAVFN